jgi:non-ribosomal peptide synthetase component F
MSLLSSIPKKQPTRTASNRRVCTPQLVAVVAQESPDATALIWGDKQLRYGELEAKASRLARHLRWLGIAADSVTGICLEPSFDYVISALAIWKAGGAYLPMDPSWSEEHRSFVVEDASALLVIARKPWPARTRFVVDLERGDSDLPVAHAPETRRESLACIVYSHPVEGRPEALALTHGDLLKLIFWHRRSQISADRARFQAAPGSDEALDELWPALSAGLRVEIPKAD